MVFVLPRVAHSLLLFLLLACLNFSASSTVQRLYYPSGVQRSVNEEALVGWTLCYSAGYFDASASAENILAACGPMDLMMIGASVPEEPGQIKLLAARRADDFFSNHTHTRADTFCTRFDLADRHQHNGAWWYNIDDSALGFAAKKNIFPCLGDDELDDCEHRLSWHQQQVYNGGYRLGCDVAPSENATKLVWKASNNCTIPGHVPSYLNGDFVACVSRCEDPSEFDAVADDCYVPCAAPLRQQEGAALGTCECAIEHLQGESVPNCRCPMDAVFDAQTRGCACSSPTALFDAASNSCVEMTTTPELTTNAPTTTPEPSTSTTTTTPEPFATPQPHNTTGRLYYPRGVQRNVAKDELVGWTLCYSALYDDDTASIENILAACGPMDLMMIGASEIRDPDNVAVLAARQSGDFFRNKTHTRADTFCTRFDLADRHQHNGAWWYNIDDSALGFAAKKNIFPCSGDDELDDCEHRLSWHQRDQAQLYRGYRAGCNAAPGEHFMKLVWKASNDCTIPGHVPSYLNGDFVACVSRCEDPSEFDAVAGDCYVPCAAPLRQQEGAALGTCECAIEHLQGELARSCECPDGATLDAESLQCVCSAPGTFLDAASRSCAGCDAAEQAACAPEAACSRTAEGFSCECPEGYDGAGRGAEGCQEMVPITTPLPTCNATQAAACAPEADCAVDGPEAFCLCPAGYQGHGLGPGGCYRAGCVELMEAARGCNLWVKEDLELGTGNIHGKLCVGGSMRASAGLSLGTQSPADLTCPGAGSLHEYGLVVRGDVKWDHGRKFAGAHCVGGSVDTVSLDGPLNFPGCDGDMIENGRGSGCVEVIDFDSDYAQLLELSDQLAAGPAGFHASSAVLVHGEIIVALDTAHAKHVVEVDAALFEDIQAWGFRIAAADGGSLEAIEAAVLNLVNVPSTGLSIGKYFQCGSGTTNCFDTRPNVGSRMLWNYPGASPLAAAGGAAVEGSILAPRAALGGSSSGTIRGQVVVKAYRTTISASTGFQSQPLYPAQACAAPPAPIDQVQVPGVFAKQAHAATAPLSEAAGQQPPQQAEPGHQPASATPAWVVLGMLLVALCMALLCSWLLRRQRMLSEQAHNSKVFPRADVAEHKSAVHASAADLEFGGQKEMV